jgi:hypothetical protein
VKTLVFFASVVYVSITLSVSAMQDRDSLLNDVRNSHFQDSYDTVLVGEQEILLVVKESATPITRGVAVIVRESGHGAYDSQGMAKLSEYLNQVGWVTMVMPAPHDGFALKIDDTEEPESPPATDGDPPPTRAGLVMVSADSFAAHEQQLAAQMQAVVSKTRQYPGFFMVIAQGTSAAWLTKLYSENALPAPDAMVAIAPHWPQREYNIQLPDWIANTTMPYLDIYSQWDSEWAKATIQDRKIEANKALKMVYRQRELIGQHMDAEQYRLLGKEIYGWVTSMGW